MKVFLVCSNCTGVLRIDIYSQYGAVINLISPRDAYMHNWPGSPLTQVMACCLDGAKPLLEPIITHNQLHPWEQIAVIFKTFEKNGLGNNMQSLVILSRPKCVKHDNWFIPLPLRPYIHQMVYTSNRVNKTPEKLHFVTHVIPINLWTWLLKTALQRENMISYEMITKCCNHLLGYCLVTNVKYWFISHFDKRFTAVEYIT